MLINSLMKPGANIIASRDKLLMHGYSIFEDQRQWYSPGDKFLMPSDSFLKPGSNGIALVINFKCPVIALCRQVLMIEPQ